jgi:hypothetical protein
MNCRYYKRSGRTTWERARMDKMVTLLEAAKLSDRLEGIPGALAGNHRRFNFTLPATQNVVSLIIE